ncbi:MAG: aminodeoxychorismate/anthranilate synthase component II, partial [Bacteroidota bacterium]
MKILIIDNFDSFTWNLFHYVDEFVDYAEVVRVNEVSYDKVLQFDGIILSPGPGLPDEYLAMTGIIEKYHKIKPILGICL